jgi:hypothetical protein
MFALKSRNSVHATDLRMQSADWRMILDVKFESNSKLSSSCVNLDENITSAQRFLSETI